MPEQPDGIPDALTQPVFNQPFGELTASPAPSPTQWLGNKLQDILEAAGAAPHVARHLTEGLSGIAGLTPLGIAGAAADAVDAKARGNAAGTVQAMAGMLPGAGPIERKIAEEVAPAIRAYHGSPHDFDKFSLDKIGTGEGAQVYGHGLYFAEAPETAKHYQMAVAGARGEKGHFYEVNVNADPKHFLDLDKPAGEQAPIVREALEKIGVDPKTEGRGVIDAINNRVYEDLIKKHTSTNGDFDLDALNKEVADAGIDYNTMHSKMLNNLGVRGTKYLDEGSRIAGDGSRNYVVFDDNLINIVKKYGMAGISMLPPAAAAFLTKRMTPIDNNPFAAGGNPAITPVDHDPWNPEDKT